MTSAHRDFARWLGTLTVCLVMALPSAAWATQTLVVVADVMEGPTENARLRAKIYDAARRRRYEPLPAADAVGVARSRSMLKGGRVTQDPDELARLRAALKADVLVRVARGETQGDSISLSIVAVSSTKAEPSQATVTDPPKMQAVIDAVVPVLNKFRDRSPPDVEETPATPTAFRRSRADEPAPPHENSTIENWEERGGLVPMFAAGVLLTGIQISDLRIRDTQGGADGMGNANGVGGAPSFRLGFVYLNLPDPVTSRGIFPALRFGTGLDLTFAWMQIPETYSYDNRVPNAPRHVERRNTGYVFGNVPLQLGFQLGIGKFTTTDSWRGVLLGVAYSPTMTLSFDIAREFQSTKDFYINPAGFELSVDITAINVHREHEKPNIRLSILGLPPIKKKKPAMISAGVAAVWY